MLHRFTVMLLALFLDLILGDPPNRFHPVVLMGRWLQAGRVVAANFPPTAEEVRRRGDFTLAAALPLRRPPVQFWFGAGWVLTGMALFSLPLGKIFNRLNVFSTMPIRSIITQGILLWLVVSYRNLRRAAAMVATALINDDLPEARRLLGWHLVSRDTAALSAGEVAGATIESLAENVTDGLTAPLMAYRVGGLPLAWGYRFVNTADAMWGYRNQEFAWLGKFPARLDDIFNWLPARCTGWLLVTAAWLVGEDAGQAVRIMLTQHRRTPSPNAGWTMSAAAGALDITLTKRQTYTLGDGHTPLTAHTIRRAIRLTDVAVGLLAIIVALWCLLSRKTT